MTSTKHRAAHAAALTAIAMVAVLAAGCGKAAPAASPTSAPPSAAVDPGAPALAAYQGFVTAYIRAGHSADAKDPGLATFLADPFLGIVQDDLSQQAAHGHVYTGTIASTPKVTAVDVKAGTATITDCMDISAWKVASKDTGAAATVPPNISDQVTVTATATRDSSDHWRIHDTKQNGGCYTPSASPTVK